MKRRVRLTIGGCLVVAFAALAAGCTEFVADTARTSLASFFSTVLTEAVNTTVAPKD